MKTFIKLHLILLLNFWLRLQHVSALITLPTEDLLGPEVCPAGSFCIETSYCTTAYYTTKFGLPFYCGPNQNIDSKVCCIENEDTATKPNIDLKHDALELEKIGKGLPTSNFTHFNSTDDDEVEILSLPFVPNHVEEIPFDSESILSEPDSGLERTIGDLEALLEDVIEQEFNSAQPSPSHNVRETGFKPVDAHQGVQHDFEHSNRVDETLDTDMHLLNALRQEQVESQTRAGHIANSGDEHNAPIESKSHYDNQKQRAFTCPCEKGEKGDIGPKGEPGEPGKIIYIPVFVNTAGTPLGAAYGVAPAGAPVQFTASQTPLNQPPHGQIPHHLNPTVVPYNVPINIPTPPQPQTTPQQTYQQQQVQQHQPPPPSLHPISYTADDIARLSRHTQQYQDQRFANRRY